MINMALHVSFLYYKKKGWYDLVIEKILEQRQSLGLLVLRKKKEKKYFRCFLEKSEIVIRNYHSYMNFTVHFYCLNFNLSFINYFVS